MLRGKLEDQLCTNTEAIRVKFGTDVMLFDVQTDTALLIANVEQEGRTLHSN